MSFKLMAQALDIKTGSPTAKLILLKLCDNANDKGECWPSQDTIAEQCELGKRTVVKTIQRLENLGLVAVNKGPKNRNFYQLNLSSANIALVHEVHLSSANSALLSSADSALPYIEPINKEPIKEPINKKQTKKFERELLAFDEFREKYKKQYGGKVRGNQTEFENFIKKKGWEKVIDSLSVILESQIKERESIKKKGEFVPLPKNLSTWINQRCWEEESILETQEEKAWRL